VLLHAFGGPEGFGVDDVEDPIIGPEDVLVDVAATALNRADLGQRSGSYGGPGRALPVILGMEFAGTVAEVGGRVTMWRPGDRVMAIVTEGAYAERVAVHERQLMAVPDNLDLRHAAAIPEVFLTAWDALVLRGGLTSGRWALVHAGASGVGTAAIQIARAMGARVAATCSAHKRAACHDLGADLVLERSPHDWLSDALAAVPGGFDTVIDLVGGDEIDRNFRAVAPQGTIVQVGLMAGASVSVDARSLVTKRAAWVGTVLRPRPFEEKVALTRRFATEVLPWFASGTLQPVVDSTFPFDQMSDAHRHMEANANTGKIVVTFA
jgi:putative PIG3 family NAD(P)H quinone oxidoreductase